MVPPHGAVALVPASRPWAAAPTAIDPPQGPARSRLCPRRRKSFGASLGSTPQERVQGILRLGSIAIGSRRRAEPRGMRQQSTATASAPMVSCIIRFTSAGLYGTSRAQVVDPDTGRRVNRPNPESEWVCIEGPHLRIVSDDLFATAQAPKAGRVHPRTTTARKPKRMLSGFSAAARAAAACRSRIGGPRRDRPNRDELRGRCRGSPSATACRARPPRGRGSGDARAARS
jgi:hypothetical protein